MCHLRPDRTVSECLGAILGGGKQSRLRGKGGLVVGGSPILERAIGALRSVFEEVCLVVGQEDHYPEVQLRRVRDELPDRGPLGGIHAVLKAAGRPCFVVGCDMPFLGGALIAYMTTLAEGYDAIVPSHAGGYEPLHALYSPSCLPAIEENLRQSNLKLGDLLKGLHVREVGEEEIGRFGDPRVLFFNVNTGAALEVANRVVEGRALIDILESGA